MHHYNNMEKIKKEIVKSNVGENILSSVWLFSSGQCTDYTLNGEGDTVINRFSFFSYRGTK